MAAYKTIGYDVGSGDETVVVRCSPDSAPVFIDERDGTPICRDFDEDCSGVADPLGCYLYDPGQGRCPLVSSGRKIKL